MAEAPPNPDILEPATRNKEAQTQIAEKNNAAVDSAGDNSTKNSITQNSEAQLSFKTRLLHGCIDWTIILLLSVMSILCLRNKILFTPIGPSGDSAMHLVEVSSFCQTINSCHSLWEALATFWVWPSIYPPGTYLITYIYNCIAGFNANSTFFSELVFLPILCISVYFLCRHGNAPYWSQALSGASALLLVFSLQTFTIHMCSYLLDFPLTTITVACLCLLLYCEGFSHRGYTLALGLVCGLGMLIKYTLLWYLTLPILIIALRCLPKWLKSYQHLITQIGFGGLVFFTYCTCAQLIVKQSNEYAISPALVPNSSLIMLAIVSFTCVIWFYQANYTYSGQPQPTLTNAIRGLTISLLLAAPWYINNYEQIKNRAVPVLHDVPFVLRHFIESMSSMNNVYSEIFIWLTVLSALLILWRPAQLSHILCTISSLSGILWTFILLGSASRYLNPVLALNAIILSKGAQRLPGAIILLLLYSVLATTNNLIFTSIDTPFINPKNPINWRALDSITRKQITTNEFNLQDSLFMLGYRICPTIVELCPQYYSIEEFEAKTQKNSSDTEEPLNDGLRGEQSCLPITVALLHNDDCPEFAESSNYGVQFWSEWNSRRIISFRTWVRNGQLYPDHQLPFLVYRLLQSYIPYNKERLQSSYYFLNSDGAVDVSFNVFITINKSIKNLDAKEHKQSIKEYKITEKKYDSLLETASGYLSRANLLNSQPQNYKLSRKVFDDGRYHVVMLYLNYSAAPQTEAKPSKTKHNQQEQANK